MMEHESGNSPRSWIAKHTSTVILGVFVLVMILLGRFVLISADSYYPTTTLGGDTLPSARVSPEENNAASVPSQSPVSTASPSSSPTASITPL